MANDLADQFTGTAVVTFGAAFLTDQGGSSFGDKELAELEVALLAEAKFGGGAQGAELTLPFNEHGQFAGDYIRGGGCKSAGIPGPQAGGGIKLKHGLHLERTMKFRYAEITIRQKGVKV